MSVPLPERAASPTAAIYRASIAETAAVATTIGLPLVARGLIRRRPRIKRAAEAVDVDRHAVTTARRLRARHGDGIIDLRVPGRRVALVLDGDAARRILTDTPEPFAAATEEKQAALAHFQPRGVLASHGRARTIRRELNEQVLDSNVPVHRAVGRAVRDVVIEEVAELRAALPASGRLDWDTLLPSWYRVVRRVTLGDAARDDHAVTDLLARLRDRGNWAYARRKDVTGRERFLTRIADHVVRAEAGSLVGELVANATDPDAAPVEQVPQWLFAFEPAGMATLRAAVLLAAHPQMVDTIRAERDADEEVARLPTARATILESLRLWPTTPAILRSSTAPTDWGGSWLPADTSYVIFVPAFHRDPDRLEDANRFAPQLWGDGQVADPLDGPPLLPFSDGGAICPGRNLVLLVASTFLSELMRAGRPEPDAGTRLDPQRLPSVLDPFTASLRLAPTGP